MKITVKTPIKVRIGAPSSSAPSYQLLAPGSEIEVDGNLYEGDTDGGINKWYKDGAGNFYWSGGFDQILSNSTASLQNIINYNELIRNVPDEFKNTKGTDIKIAVLDTGIYQEHPDLADLFSNNSMASYDFTKSKVNYNDINGHGTHVTGLIAARSKRNIGIIGIAPNCSVQNIKILLDSGDSVGDIFISGLNQLISQVSTNSHVDIVNLSLGITIPEYFEAKSLIDELSKSSIIVGAAGENERLLISNTPLCPAYSPNVISVGVIDQDFYQIHANSIFHHRVDYLMPYTNLMSCSNKDNNYKQLKGSSMATAIVSGLVALILSYNNKENKNIEFIKAELDKSSIPYDKIKVTDFSNLVLIKPRYT